MIQLSQKLFNRFLCTVTGERWYYRVGGRLVQFEFKGNVESLAYNLEMSKLSQVNAEKMKAFPERFWPNWVYKQCLSMGTGFQAMGPMQHLLNTRYRNWSEVRQPGLDVSSQVDPSGLVTPYPKGWSVESFLALNEKKVESSSMQEHFLQSVEKGIVTTKTVIHSISVKTSCSIHYSPDREALLVQEITLKNISGMIHKGSYYVGIRPYNIEGISPISEIVYLSKKAFVVDDRLAVILEDKPDNVVCHSALDGDLGSHFAPMQMILEAKCKDHLTSAYAQYDFQLDSGEERVIRLRMPVEDTAPMRGVLERVFSPSQTEKLGKRVQSILRRSSDKAQDYHLKLYERAESELFSARFPSAKWTRVFKQSKHQLLSYIGAKGLNLPDGYYRKGRFRTEIQVYFTLLQMGGNDLVWDSFQFWLDNLSKSLNDLDPDELGQLLCVIYRVYQFQLDSVWLKDHFKLIDKLVKRLSSNIVKNQRDGFYPGLVKPTRSQDGRLEPEQYLQDTFSALAGFESAVQIADILKKDVLKQCYQDLSSRLLLALDQFLKKRQHEFPDCPLPVSVQTPLNDHLVSVLSAVFPYGILKPTDSRMGQVRKLIDTYFMESNRYLRLASGYSVEDTFRVSHFLQSQIDSDFFNILQNLVSETTEVGNWPESIHPIEGTGSDGLGCSVMASVTFLQVCMQLFAMPMGNRLVVLSPFPEKWIEKPKWKCKVSGLFTVFGKLSYTVEKYEDKITFEFLSSFHSAPSDFVFIFPKSIIDYAINGEGFVALNKGRVKVPSDIQSVSFRF